MSEPKPLQSIDIEEGLTICPECDYSDGFHVAFVPGDDGMKIILVCPSCSARFDIGWMTR